jgi:protein LSM14
MSAATPYIGSKISLVTSSDLRYEGVLININTAQSTVTLRDVRMTGTERAGQFVMPTNEVYDYIVFNGKDIKDLTVSEPAPATTSMSARQDPAVVAVNIPPHHLAGGYSAGGPAGGYNSGYNNGYNSGYNNGPGYGRYDDGPAYGQGRRTNTRFAKGNVAGSRVVGELSAQPNNSLKQQVADAFDFEQANTKFAKDPADVPSAAGAPAAYNRETSFFDNISCEALSRKNQVNSNRVDREKQRELDTETFGPGAAASNLRYPRRPFKRNRNAPRGGAAQAAYVNRGYLNVTY